jgi:pimeloyl-ACP methyl ester carboxylesterase
MLVHGWTCDASAWERQRKALDPHFRVLTLDLPGHGKAPLPKRGLQSRTFAHAINSALERAKVSRVVLIGHSMGGIVVRQFARLYPHKVRALVFVETAFDLTETPEDRAWLKAFRGRDAQQARRAFIQTLFHRSTPAALRKRITQQMLATPVRIATAAWQWMSRPQTGRPDDYFTGPVLAIDGATAEPLGPAVRTMFPQLQRVVIKSAGHFVMLERPAAFNRTLLAFLRSLVRDPK